MPAARKTTSAAPTTKKAPAAKRPAKPAAASVDRTLSAVIAELKRLGKDGYAKTYKRHGAVDPVFGVSFGDLKALAKSIKQDHALARELWATGNFDAQNLAAMIADPAAFKAADLDAWVKSVNSHAVAGSLGAAACRSPHAAGRIVAWAKSKADVTRQCADATLSHALKHEVDLPVALVRERLRTIERDLHTSPNRVKEGMNAALIAIGVYCDELHAEALAVAKRLGPVRIDHGDTDCRDFDAVTEINKAVAHREKKARK